MYEKRIKTFFNSVKVCGEFPDRHWKIDKRLIAMAEIAAGVMCAVISCLLLMQLVERCGKEMPESD